MLSLLFAGVACDDKGAGDYIDLPPLTPAPRPLSDAAVDFPVPDGAVLCTQDAQCDDGVPCTRDVCVQGLYCQSVPTQSRCDDGIFCNGAEDCLAETGCVAGAPVVCNDRDVCTIDACDEMMKSCTYAPRDFDGDGEADWHCAGGTDCDDFDDTTNARALELCSDGKDNNCDGQIDEATCGRAPHDVCEDALDISADGTYALELLGTVQDYDLECGPKPWSDAVVTFELTEPRDVRLMAQGVYVNGSQELATIAVRSDCQGPSFECESAFPGQVRMRALPKGRYYAIVDVAGAPRALVTAQFDDPTEAPTNTSCASPQMLGSGTRVAADFVDVTDDLTSPCGVRDGDDDTIVPQADLVYQFTLDAPQNVALSAISPTGDPLTLSVRSTCTDAATTLTCTRGEPADAVLHSLEAGTYFVVVESPTYVEADFELDFRVLPPSPPPVGDECTDPEPLATDGVTVLGSLVSKQARVATSCDQHVADTVYEFTLAKPTDINLEVTAGGSSLGVALQRTCGDPSSELACLVGRGSKRRFRNLGAGSYSLVLESYDAREVTVAVELLPRTQPVTVAGNETCETAFDVPSAGGLFSGDTTGGINDYFACGNSRSSDATYRLVLDRERTVRVSTEAGFDTILYRFDGTELGPSACSGNLEACNDDSPDVSGVDSQLEELLPAGTYYYVVDGYHVASEGPYVVRFELE